MSFNIYECIDDGNGRLEKRVDIYDSAEFDHMTHARGAHTPKPPPAVQRNPFKTTALILVLLCLLLLAGITVLSKLFIEIILKEDQQNTAFNKLAADFDNLTADYDNLKSSYCHLEKENQTQGSNGEWKRFGCSCYYTSTDMKNWTESREDCEKRGGDLVIIKNKEEQEFVSKLNKHGDSWIGLEMVQTNDWKKKWIWTWLDGSTASYMVWKAGVIVNPEDDSKVYIDQQGTWIHTSTYNETKHWICERQI